MRKIKQSGLIMQQRLKSEKTAYPFLQFDLYKINYFIEN